MVHTISDYEKVAGKEQISEIKQKARKLKGKRIVTISSTHIGGGVAEILNSTIPLYNDLGIQFGWRTLHGTNDFFSITKKFHNALQGEKIDLTKKERKIYLATNERFAKFTHLNHDLVIVHDPQPLPIIDHYEKKQPWIYRCHIDITSPHKKTFNFLNEYVNKYDHVVVSKSEYKKKSVKPQQSIIYPAIDPLSPKNDHLSDNEIDRQLAKKGLNREKPIVCQVSRFDKWKDFIGVIRVFEKVRNNLDCQLVLAGVYASDDPEGAEIYKRVIDKSEESRYFSDIHVVFGDSEIFVNALQRASDVIVQKSIREGFGLTIAEALYKETPVVASKVGGIPLQVVDGKNGFLHDHKDETGFAKSILKILGDDDLKKEFGIHGKEHIRKNFLTTRLMNDWLSLANHHLHKKNILVEFEEVITKIRNHN